MAKKTSDSQMPLGEPVTPPSPVAPPQVDAQPVADDRPSLDDRVDEWLSAHPEDKDFDANAPTEPPATEPSPSPDATPVGQQPPPDTKPADAQPVAQTPPQPPPAEPPKAQPTGEQPAAELPKVTPKSDEPIKFSLDSKYSFGEGTPTWTGQQVMEALREREQLIPRAQDAQVYYETFGMPATEARELWGPNIVWMRQNPQALEMIAQMIEDPLRTDYLLNCSRYWDSPDGQQLRAQNPRYAPSLQPKQQQLPANLSAEVEQRFRQLEAQNQALQKAERDRTQKHFTDRIARDLNVAFERYPYLRDNPAMVQALLARAYWINGGDDSENAKGVLEALEMEKPLYDAQLVVYNQANQNAAHPPQTPPQPPPLMGSAGASPQGTQPTHYAQPKKFSDLDDAVDDWVNNPPAQYR